MGDSLYSTFKILHSTFSPVSSTFPWHGVEFSPAILLNRTTHEVPMRHQRRGRKLNRNASHRLALYRNLSRALIMHETIKTTLPKAKELRMFVEKLITLAKNAAIEMAKGTEESKARALHLRRQAMAKLGPMHGTGLYDKKDEPITDKTVLKKLFSVIGPRYLTRPGGYTRVLKMHYRRLGDAGHTAVIELLKEGEVKIQRRTAPVAPAPVPVMA
jgi:large subunit ribosomal protein L17